MSHFKLSTLAVLLTIAILFPWLVANDYVIHITIIAGIFITQAISLNFVLGYVGLLSLGHTALFAIGAYTSALLDLRLGAPFALAFVGACLVTGFFGFLVGYVCLRMRGPYFAIVTFGLSQIIYLICLNWIDLTQGPMALVGISPAGFSIPGLFSFELVSKTSYYYLILILVLGSVYVSHKFSSSYIGRAWRALRENENLADSVGISWFKYSMMAFVISTIMVGGAGSFYAHFITVVSPEIFGLANLVAVLTMVVVGGQATIAGPIVGGLIFTYLPEVLRVVQMYRMALYGSILLAAVVFIPGGIVNTLRPLLPSWFTPQGVKGGAGSGEE
jgi:branched-chain amino acid transport system permease protein